MKRLAITSGQKIGIKAKPSWICDACGSHGTKKVAHPKICKSKPVYFSTKTELKCYRDLQWREAAGLIRGIERQPKFGLLADGGVKVGFYVADFLYFDLENNKLVVVDVKGRAATELAMWKLRHFKAQCGFDVTIV